MAYLYALTMLFSIVMDAPAYNCSPSAHLSTDNRSFGNSGNRLTRPLSNKTIHRPIWVSCGRSGACQPHAAHVEAGDYTEAPNRTPISLITGACLYACRWSLTSLPTVFFSDPNLHGVRRYVCKLYPRKSCSGSKK